MKIRLLSFALILCCASAADAATITVETVADDPGFNPNVTISTLTHPVSLRDAVNAANNTPGDDEIVCPGGQSIYLTQVGLAANAPDTQQSALNITSTIIIRGNGAVLIKDPQVYPLRIFNVASNGNLTLENATLQGGAERIGGGILNYGVLTVRSSTIKDCLSQGTNATGFDRGAGIYSTGTSLTVTNCTFVNNKATTSGGAIFNAAGKLTVADTTFNNNSAWNSGGAILNLDNGGLSTVSGCTFSGNQLPGIPLQGKDANDGFGGGAIRNNGVLTVSTSTFSSNKVGTFAGGAIYNNGTLTLNANTFVGNQSVNQIHQGFGGAFYNQATATVTNCTFTQNFGDDGTAINSAGNITLNHCTIVSQNGPTDSVAAGVALQGTATIKNSIICLNYWYNSNTQTANLRNVSGSFTGSNNLIDNASPGVGPLTSNGGPTQTMALQGGTAAIDAGIATGVTTDQRGIARPQGSAVDIGAFEYGLLPPQFTSANATTFIVGNNNTFGVIANALPPATYSVTGTLPSGVTFTASGLLSGTPAAGTKGTYPLTFTAVNSYGQATQSFVLTVIQPDTIVTTAVDEDDGSTDPSLGTGTSLREAINKSNAGPAGQVIMFSPALAGQTIQPTTGGNLGDGLTAFIITKDVTIQGTTGANGITLAPGVAGSMRAFQVPGGATVTLNDLTLANWHASYGVVVLHQGGAVLNRCTVRDNVGNGIIAAAGITAATFENSTVTNNDGGYALICNGFYTLKSCTVARNIGGGLYVSNNGATVVNSLIAGNTNPYNSNPADFPFSFLRSGSSNNLFGTGVSSSFSSTYSGVNGNIVGVPSAQLLLGALANNGGPTQTIALLTGSPAIDKGTLANGSDQRGVARPQYSAPDIGAYEFDGLHNSLVVTTTVDELDSTSDPNYGAGTSLREAFAYAQSLSGPHTITFSPSLSGGQVISLSQGELVVTGNVTFDGSAAPGLTISGNGTNRILRVAPGGTAALNSLTLSNGVSGGSAHGGAIYHNGASLSLQNCTLRENQVINGAYGGAISADSGSLNITGCTFSNNQSTGGNGGAIVNWGTQLTIANSTFAENTALNGGAFISYGNTSILTNCTVVNNSVTYTGGGVERVGHPGNTVSLQNTLLAGNTAGQAGPNLFSYNEENNGAFTSLGNNLVANGDGNIGLTNGSNADQVGTGAMPINPNIGPLQDNGGPTETFALLEGSRAIDAAATIGGLILDQRGTARPQGSAPDIGAFELAPSQAAAIPIVGPLGGSYQDSVQISIASTSAGTAVRYTLDGSTPSPANGLLYTGPFNLARNATVKAIAYNGGWLPSPVASVGYTVLMPLPYWRALQGLAVDGSEDTANPSGDGISNLAKFAFNLAPNAGDLAKANFQILTANGTAGLPLITRDGQGHLVITFVRRKASSNPNIAYIVETGSDLNSLTSLNLAGATVASIDSTWERVTVTDPTISTKRFGRVRIQSLGTYFNDFNAALGAATLRGSGVWTNGAVKLTDEIDGGFGAVTFDGITAGPQLTGFVARFNLQLGPTTGTPADGANFAVGDLGSGAWGEGGPATAHNLSVGFDTFNNGNGAQNDIGIHLWINGTHITASATNPYTNGALVPVEITFESGFITVKFNGTTVFNNVAANGFSFLTTDKFGIGARTGGAKERCVVDDVQIAPR